MAENLCIFEKSRWSTQRSEGKLLLLLRYKSSRRCRCVSLSVFLDVQRYKEEEAPTTLAQFRLSLATSHTNIAVRSAPPAVSMVIEQHQDFILHSTATEFSKYVPTSFIVFIGACLCFSIMKLDDTIKSLIYSRRVDQCDDPLERQTHCLYKEKSSTTIDVYLGRVFR